MKRLSFGWQPGVGYGKNQGGNKFHSKKWYETRRLVKFGIEHTKKKFHRKLVKNGYDLCPDCSGERFIKRKITKPIGLIRTRKSTCMRCRGIGFVDWINRIVGRSLK